MQPGVPAAALMSCVRVARLHSVPQLLAALESVSLLCEAHAAARGAARMHGPGQVCSAGEVAEVAAATGGTGAVLVGAEASPVGGGQPSDASVPAPEGPLPRVLIVDSVAAVVGPVLGMPQHSQGYVLVAALGRMLRQLAAAHSLAVVVTNHLVASRAAEGKETDSKEVPWGGAQAGANTRHMVPAMGEMWKGQVHRRLLLQLTAGGPEGPRRAVAATSLSVSVSWLCPRLAAWLDPEGGVKR